MELLGAAWNEVIIRPMINSLVLLYAVFFNNFGLSIIGFTILVRLAMVPLTVKQSRQMKAMAALQPKMKEIQKKHSSDKQKASKETMKLYKEQGVNPLGCLGPLVIQMPIFFGLFWSLRGTLPSTPERLADLGGQLYSWLPLVHEAVPLNGTFLWMDLAQYASQDTLPILLPLLVGGSMWLMQKMTPTSSATPQQEQTQRLMLWMMPIMFGVFTLNFEMGLALYWIVSNIVGIVIQGFVTGWTPVLSLLDRVRGTRAPAAVVVATPRRRKRPMEETTDEQRHEIETTAKTADEAIELALRELDAERAEVEIDVVSRGKAGILGIGSEPARVRVTMLEAPSDVIRVATTVLKGLISAMGVDAVVNLKQAHLEDIGGPVFEVDGDDAGLLIGRRGETLRALQFMLRLMVSRELGERANLLLDVGGYQERRNQSLSNMARRVGESVVKTGLSVKLEPMPPNERRVIHVTLAEYRGVATFSTGEGDGRQIVVEPSDD